jgi:hypothetical protein
VSIHHDRVRAVLLVAGLEGDRRGDAGEVPVTAAELTARLARIQACLDRLRPPEGAGPPGGALPGEIDVDAEAWKLAVYDAALAELCAELGLRHSLADDGVASGPERQRVELELLSAVLPLG